MVGIVATVGLSSGRPAAMNSLDTAEAYGQDYPSEYAGAWLTNDSELRVAFTDELPDHQQRLSRRLGATPFELVKARFSRQQLQSLVEQISGDRTDLEALGVHVAGVGEDTVNNKVVVRVMAMSDEVVDRLYKRYGTEALEIRQGGPFIAA